MPFTRHPLDYPINRLFLRVGMALQLWIQELPPMDRSARKEWERSAAEYLGLEEAVRAELVKSYKFVWDRRGKLVTIRIVPHPRVRRTPGIKRLKEIFFSGPAKVPPVRPMRDRSQQNLNN